MHFSAKCNSGRIAIQWFHIKHYLDYQYTKFQPYTFRVQKMCVFARYATLVPRLLCIQKTESKRVIVGTLNTKTNSCVTLVPTEKACSSAQKTKMTPCFENK